MVILVFRKYGIVSAVTDASSVKIAETKERAVKEVEKDIRSIARTFNITVDGFKTLDDLSRNSGLAIVVCGNRNHHVILLDLWDQSYIWEIIEESDIEHIE